MDARIRKQKRRKKPAKDPQKQQDAQANELVISADSALVHVEPDEENGVTPLMQAARTRNAVMFSMLLEAGHNINQVDNKGKTVLMHALENKNVSYEIILPCVLLCANVEYSYDCEGQTAFEYAYSKNHAHAIELMFRAKDSFKEYIKLKQYIMLHAFTKNYKMALLFMSLGAEIHVPDATGNTMMHYLMTGVFLVTRVFDPILYALISTMISSGATLDSKNNEDTSPIDVMLYAPEPSDFMLKRLKTWILFKQKEIDSAFSSVDHRKRIKLILEHVYT